MKLLAFFGVLLFPLVSAATDLAITNVKGYTMTPSGKLVQFSNLTIEDGKVASLSPSIEDIDSATRKIDGKGRVLLPGLIDAHGHLLGLGDELRQVNLRGTASEAEAVAKVRERLEYNLGSPWILGRGWNQELWASKAFPTRNSLDDMAGERPIWLMRIDNHAGWANSKALEIAGITRDTPDPAGGIIVKDAQGEPTGVLIDNAMNLMESVLPKTSKHVMEEQLQLAGEHLLSHGITGMHDAGISRTQYEFYLIKAAQHQLPIRIYAMVAATDPDLDTMLDNGHIADALDMLHIRSVKVYGDGALGSRGAALLTQYSDKPEERGLLVTVKADIDDLFEKIAAQNFQINYHAIGDRANRLALDTFEKLPELSDAHTLRHRVEHAQVINIKDLKRFHELGVLASMQPTHATSDMNMAEDRLGPLRMKGAYAWKTLWDMGTRIPLGSDFPVELANPFYGLHAAVSRQDRNNLPENGWFGEEALTIEQAFDGFTRTAAYAAHMEAKVGMLAEGYWADFIFVDQDPFEVDAKDLWKTRVLSTWIAGEKRFDSGINPL